MFGQDRETQATVDRIRLMAERIRIRVLEHTIKNNGGYLSQACSSAEIISSLYCAILKIGVVETPIEPPLFTGVPGPGNKIYKSGAEFNGSFAPEYDRFILSPSQYALTVYTALIEAGRMTSDALDSFNKDGSVLEMIGAEHSPGMEVMTGSLGQGISQAAGIAMGRRLKGERGRVVLFLSDGECQSGQFWEAVQAMSFHRLENMLAFVDINGYQCDGKMRDVMNIEPFEQRLSAFGMRVSRIDGHNIEALLDHSSREPDGRPTFILCDTDACRGIDILQKRIPKLHYIRFISPEEKLQYQTAFAALMQNQSGLKTATM